MNWKMLRINLLKVCCSIFILFSIVSCVKGEDILEKGKKLFDQEDLPEKTSDTVTLISMKEEKIDWFLKAEHVKEFAKKKKIYAKKMTIYVFDSEDNIVSTMTADSAKIDEVKKMLKAESNVKILSSNGVLETSVLYWNLANNSIFTKERVKITRGENVMYGKNLYTDVTLNSAKLDDIKGEGEVEENNIDF